MSLLDNSYALISVQGRSIATIVPDVVVEEHHTDDLLITDHPVELGAMVSDHAFKKPAEVDMRVGFSNSSAGSEGAVQQAYMMLLALQAQRQPFDVSTGKRQYQNMLVRSITVVTDPTSEWALNAVVGLREVIIVDTQQSGGGTPGIGATADQANPASTQPTQDAGTVQLQPVTAGTDGANFGLSGVEPVTPTATAPTEDVGEIVVDTSPAVFSADGAPP